MPKPGVMYSATELLKDKMVQLKRQAEKLEKRFSQIARSLTKRSRRDRIRVERVSRYWPVTREERHALDAGGW